MASSGMIHPPSAEDPLPLQAGTEPAPPPAAPWQIWIGSFRPEQFQGLDRQSGAVLLFGNQSDPDTDLAPLVRLHAAPRGPWISTALLASQDGEAPWYSYSDSRQNGPQSPELLRQHWPNLRPLQKQRLLQQRLDTLLEAWVAEDRDLAAALAADGGQLWLSMLHPEPVLAGLGSWRARFDDILWSPPGSLALARQRIDGPWQESLELGCFTLEPDLAQGPDGQTPALRLRQDPLLVLQARSQAQAQRISELELELEQQRRLLQDWQQRHHTP